jgi:ATP-dependent Lon protease
MDKYLIPQAIQNAGLNNLQNQFEFSSSIRDFIIQNYAREAGVRSLKNFVNRIMEKIAYKLVDAQD